MKCQYCDRDARVLVTQVINGETRKFSMCKACAEERGLFSDGVFGLEKLLLEGIASADESGVEGEWAGSGMVNQMLCGSCGFSFEDLQRVGRLGCPDCYRAFRAQIGEMIREVQPAKWKHVGKCPQVAATRLRREADLEDLKERQKAAIRSEDYELAGKLRDQIRELEAGEGGERQA